MVLNHHKTFGFSWFYVNILSKESNIFTTVSFFNFFIHCLHDWLQLPLHVIVLPCTVHFSSQYNYLWPGHGQPARGSIPFRSVAARLLFERANRLKCSSCFLCEDYFSNCSLPSPIIVWMPGVNILCVLFFRLLPFLNGLKNFPPTRKQTMKVKSDHAAVCSIPAALQHHIYFYCMKHCLRLRGVMWWWVDIWEMLAERGEKCWFVFRFVWFHSVCGGGLGDKKCCFL